MDSLVRFSELNQSTPFEFHFMLSKQKVSDLIKRLDLLDLKKVSLFGVLSPISINDWSLFLRISNPFRSSGDEAGTGRLDRRKKRIPRNACHREWHDRFFRPHAA